MVQEVAQHPGNSWPTVPLRAPCFLPPYRSQLVLQLRLSCQIANGGGVRSPNGEVVGDRITGGSAKKILLLVQRNQILLARSYFLCARHDVHVEIEVPLGIFLPDGFL